MTPPLQRMRTAARRGRYRVASAWAACRLIATAVRGRDIELWVGDSHARCFNGPRTPAPISRHADGQFVAYLGPRLMFSVARTGFPLWLVRLAGRLSHRRSGRLSMLFCFGEIDVRCHLVALWQDDKLDLDFVDHYAERCRDLARTARANRILFVTPPPPSIDCPVQPEFPVVGAINERIATWQCLCDRLSVAVARAAGDPRSGVIDLAPGLADAAGGLRRELTDDGCHTNASGVIVVRDMVHRDLAATP